ncbi:unnamed protein product [Zymoseptoria tritici ST99CH_1A5]|uniref:Uncharacterized protein n=3 Tax=Zymoseptoria tritici TaxID=1047171 RepID=F9XE43_ZYMTI|nr:uncharacterized protein MYCGRDRAFT_86340 [Zymoseptoria tritici IPO323]EGP86307.1 hypothetical protein MYCGRDRAFT_86340 [Zymoseptoria tritici IPO323]SMR53416.1 unnamed protein product [Zymoseptoria tritici ST99CH_1E4]SMY25032.1 unnamed protein product [Zymoseptoria tritici ST99CH_1A5]
MEIVEQPLFTKRKLRVVAIGAGFSNLTLAYKHKHTGDHSYIDLQIYEKNPEIGGTWYENRYPGAACDVPAHVYCFPFASNPNWSSFYVSGGEIFEYIKKTADDFGLRECIRLNSRVIAAVWSDERGKWDITIETSSGETIQDEADILVNGSGFLNSWKWPDIPGIKDYKGELIHSANWRDVDLSGKKVGLIGNGSTGVQILPQIQQKAASVHSYMRTPTWIIPNFLGDHTPEGKNFAYTEQQKQRWRAHPEELEEVRRTLEHAFNQSYPLFLKDSPQQIGGREWFAGMMKERLGGDEELIKRLVPDYEVGCRRITPGEGYLEALQSDNVHKHFEPIVRFTESGIISQPAPDSEPQTTELDVVICATGFDVSFKPAWTMKGLHGADLKEIWKDDSEAFLGIFAPEMPNYFTATGPNTPTGVGSIFGMIDATAEYILKWCSKIAGEGIKSVTVKPDVLREFNDYSQAFLQRTVWSGGCKSWYRNAAAGDKVRAMYPGSLIHFRQMLDAFRTEDFDIVPWNPKNRFTFMGNGFTELEAKGGNLAYYLDG